MKVIDYDPATKVPPLHENDLTRKMVIAIDCNPKKKIISFARKKSDGTVGFFTADQQNNVIWLFSFKNSANLLELIVNDWNDVVLLTSSYVWTTIAVYFIIESSEELVEFLEQHKVVDPLRNIMLSYWQRNHKIE